ncbi:MAG: hypothetical protein MI919_02595 [Holophagales bacterium]|nr:hypothetical protein [Holophagales bacterium]
MSPSVSPVGEELIAFFSGVVEDEGKWIEARADFDALVEGSSLSAEAKKIALGRNVEQLVEVMGLGGDTYRRVAVVVIAATRPYHGGDDE